MVRLKPHVCMLVYARVMGTRQKSTREAAVDRLGGEGVRDSGTAVRMGAARIEPCDVNPNDSFGVKLQKHDVKTARQRTGNVQHAGGITGAAAAAHVPPKEAVLDRW
eukprot:SAG31_NODE_12582_length_931_cov_1.080529_2_plen_107_part_00